MRLSRAWPYVAGTEARGRKAQFRESKRVRESAVPEDMGRIEGKKLPECTHGGPGGIRTHDSRIRSPPSLVICRGRRTAQTNPVSRIGASYAS